MLDFASRWHRFGGGSAEDIFVTFGIDRATFASRVMKLLEAPGSRLDPVQAESIRRAYE